LLLINLAQPS